MVVVEEVISHSTFGLTKSAFEVKQLPVFAERDRRVLTHVFEL